MEKTNSHNRLVVGLSSFKLPLTNEVGNNLCYNSDKLSKVEAMGDNYDKRNCGEEPACF